mmetsp:Transcript_6886/g.11830  ORF Transcript_6886/g.11830 Transcript_6886/m.11830 type:complete len:121 (-) Transcript_6886:69-431(-)
MWQYHSKHSTTKSRFSTSSSSPASAPPLLPRVSPSQHMNCGQKHTNMEARPVLCISGDRVLKQSPEKITLYTTILSTSPNAATCGNTIRSTAPPKADSVPPPPPPPLLLPFYLVSLPRST